MTQRLIRALSECSVDVSLVNKNFSRSVEHVGRASLLKLLKVFPLLFQVARRAAERPDAAIVFVTNRPASFFVDLLILVQLRLLRIPVIAYVHTIGFERIAQRQRALFLSVRAAFASVERTVVLSETLKHDVSRFANANTIDVIPNTIDARVEELLPRRPGPTPLVIFVSNLLPEKGAHLFVKAAIPLAEKFGWQFEVYGASGDPDYVEGLEREILFSGLSHLIGLHGVLSGDEKWQLFSKADLLVFPSTYKYEAQPLVLIEALAAGLPAVAFDVGAASDMVVDGLTGVIVSPPSTSALEEAMEALLHDRPRLEDFSARCREHFGSRFSQTAYSARWVEVLGDVVEGRGRV